MYKKKYEELVKDLALYFEQRTQLMNRGSKLERPAFDSLFLAHDRLDKKLKAIVSKK